MPKESSDPEKGNAFTNKQGYGCLACIFFLCLAIASVFYFSDNPAGVILGIVIVAPVVFVMIATGGDGSSGCAMAVLMLIIVSILALISNAIFGWPPLDNEQQQAELKADYVRIRQLLNARPEIDEDRKKLIGEIWANSPSEARRIAEATASNPPIIPFTRDLLIVKDRVAEPDSMEWNERNRIRAIVEIEEARPEREKDEALQKKKEKERRLRSEIFSKIYKKDESLANGLAKRVLNEEITKEELLEILTKLEEREASAPAQRQ